MLFTVILYLILYSLIEANNFRALAANQGKQNFRQIEKKILDSIIGTGRYDSRIRPSGANTTDSGDGPALVRVNVYVRSISRIDDVTMEYSVQITFREQWRDDRLVYDDLGGQVRYLTLTDPDRIWKPDLFFSNEKEGHFHNIIMPNVLLRIHPDGSVLYSIRISLVLACPMDLKYYPLDNQACIIKMASYGYTTEDVVFIWKEEGPVQVTSNLHLPRFTLTKFETDYCTSRTNTGEYSCVFVKLIFKREFSYYLIQIYIPCIMLVIVSWVSFWLDPNAIPARVSLGVTTLLTMATQISGINASLPPVSYTKAIDVWTGVCLTFVFGALLEFALVNYASRADAHRAAFKKKQEQSQIQGGGKDQPLNQASSMNPSFSFATGQLNSGAGQGINFQSNPTAMVQSQGWDLETGFDFDHLLEPSASGHTYGMKAVMRGPRGGNNGSSFAPIIPGPINPLLGPGTGATQSGNQARNTSGPPPIPSNGPPNGPTGATAASTFTGMGMFQSGISSSINPVHATSLVGGQNWCKKWLKNIPTRSKRIDVISRIFFPVMFGMFNVTYWLTYTYFNVHKL